MKFYLDDKLFKGTEEEFLAIEQFFCKTWKLNEKFHREDGPALIYSSGAEWWCRNGEWHRDDGPAVIYPDGYQMWYQNGKYHRDDGPAVIYSNVHQSWYQNGLLHRTDGPAEILPGGRRSWYVEGISLKEYFINFFPVKNFKRKYPKREKGTDHERIIS